MALSRNINLGSQHTRKQEERIKFVPEDATYCVVPQLLYSVFIRCSSSVYLPSCPQSLRRSLMSDSNSGFVSENIDLRLKQKLKTGLKYNKNVFVKGKAARTDLTEVCARNTQKKDFSFIIGLFVRAENQL